MNDAVAPYFHIHQMSFANHVLRDFAEPQGLRQERVACKRRDGRLAVFPKPEILPQLFAKYQSLWIQYFSQAQTLQQLARASAHFWLTFIVLHPFADANGRTAKQTLAKVLAHKSFCMGSFTLIDRYLFTGNTNKDLYELENLFLASLQQQGESYE